MDALTTLYKSRAQVVQGHAFFASLLLRQQPVESREFERLATNGKELFYNPDYVLSARPENLQASIAHEALHVGLGHHVRRGNRDHQLWNEACDYVINPILQDAGFHLAEGALFRSDLAGLTAEQAYRILQDEQRQQDPDDDDQDDGDDQQQGGDPDDQGDNDQSNDDAQDDDQADDDSSSQDGDGDEGDDDSQDADDGDQGSAGDQGDEDDGSPAEPQPGTGGFGTILDAPGDEADVAQEASECQIALTQAEGFSAGTLPGGGLVEQIASTLKPTANWAELLRRYFSAFDFSDYSWQRGNRRFLGQGLYLPSLHSESLPRILIVIDHSYSMPRRALDQAVTELQSIFSDLQPEGIDVVTHTVVVTSSQRFEAGEPIDIEIPGSGGTSFSPVCQWIDEADEQYACVVWFTDLEASDWEDCVEPQVPVLWLDWTNRNEELAQFGDEVIGLPPEDFYEETAA